MKNSSFKKLVVSVLIFILLPIYPVVAGSLDGLATIAQYFLAEGKYTNEQLFLIGIIFEGALLDGDERDIDTLKFAISLNLSESDKEAIEGSYGDVNSLISAMDILADKSIVSDSDIATLIYAIQNRDMAAILRLVDSHKEQIIQEPDNTYIPPTNVPKEETVDENPLLDVIRESIKEGKENITINMDNLFGNSLDATLNSEIIEEILAYGKNLHIGHGGITININNLLFSDREKFYISIKKIEDNSIFTYLKSSHYRKYKDLELTYYLNVDNGREGRIIENNNIEASFNILSLKNDVNVDKLGVYYFNDVDKNWEFVGGRLDLSKGHILFNPVKGGTYSLMEFKKTFKDLDNHWSKKDVELMASKHIVKGIDEERFAPDNLITRAEFVSLISRALDLKYKGSTDKVFTDANVGNWYYRDVMAAYEAGLIDGVGQGRFGASDNMTREQMATILNRVFNKGSLIDNERIESLFSEYMDTDDISSWAREGVAYAIENSIMTGGSKGKFNPRGNATRAEAAVVLKRLLQNIQ